MSLKDILVCLDPTDSGESRLRLAAAIARQHRAHLSAAYVLPLAIPGTPHRAGSVNPPTGLAWLPPDPPAPGEAGAAPELAEIIEQRFRAEVQPHAIEGDWHLFSAGEGAALVELLRAVDLAVLGQDSPDYQPPAGFRAEDVVILAGRPLLVVPYAGRFTGVGGRVLVAWDGSREATRAVHDALPLIAQAEALTVMTVRSREADFADDAPGLARLVKHLARHGIKADVEQSVRADVPIADLLLSRAADLDIDLIVTGAYHHSQLREALVGGVSRELLDHMTVPVLMSH